MLWVGYNDYGYSEWIVVSEFDNLWKYGLNYFVEVVFGIIFGNEVVSFIVLVNFWLFVVVIVDLIYLDRSFKGCRII